MVKLENTLVKLGSRMDWLGSSLEMWENRMVK